jgi:hypothetical protein
MAYLKLNNVSGKVSGSLLSIAANGTAATFSADPKIPTIASPNKLRITIAPGTANEEIVDITAHTDGTNTATVIRNVEATANGQNSAAAHSNTDWVHAPTVADFLIPGSSGFEDAVRSALTDDQIDPATAAKDFGGQRGFNVGPGIVPTDLPNIGQLVGNAMPYVISGCVWTADASGTNRNASMTAGTVMIKNVLLTVPAVTARTFTASKDTYVDFTDRGDGVATVTYTEVANNQLSPAFPGGVDVLSAIRCAIIVTGATAITTGTSGSALNQGAAISAATTPAATTVAAGSNGARIDAATLTVAANSMAPSGLALVDTSKGTGLHFATLIKYTGGGGTTTLSGITVVAGDPSGTVATSGVVTSYARWCVADSNGYRIYPTTPSPGLISARYSDANAVTSTLTTALTLASMAVPFVVPPGASREVKSTLFLPYFGSSATAGTTIVTAIYHDATNILGKVDKVSVPSQGFANVVYGSSRLAPGPHVAYVTLTQGAAGTLTDGFLMVMGKLSVELI